MYSTTSAPPPRPSDKTSLKGILITALRRSIGKGLGSPKNGITLQGINISHLGKRKIIFKMPFLGDMLVSWRVSHSFQGCFQCFFPFHHPKKTKEIPSRLILNDGNFHHEGGVPAVSTCFGCFGSASKKSVPGFFGLSVHP